MAIPPINITPETAYDITGLLPLHDTINLTGLANPQKVWFKFTLNGEFGLSIWATPENVGVVEYKPRYKYYLGLPTNPSNGILQSGSGWALEFFTETSVGVPKVGTVYISIENVYIGVGYIPTVPTTVKITKIPNTTLAPGSILVSNDSEFFPMTLVSATGVPTQLRSFSPFGESAAILINGVSLWSSNFPTNDKVQLYDANLNLIADIVWPPRTRLRDGISSNRIDTFYISGSGKVTTISATGILGPTVWTIVTDSRILYHISPSFVNNDIIFIKTFDGIGKFHKSTGILDLPYIPYEIGVNTLYYMSGYYGQEFLVMPGDNILALYSPGGSNPDKRGKVIYYSPTGTVIREFQADFQDVNRIAYATDYNSFWLWTYDDENFKSQFIQFKLSDGVRLNQFLLGTTSGGQDFTFDEGSPTNLFGVPECCPFVVSMTTLLPYGDSSGGGPGIPDPAAPDGIYYINPNKMVRHDSYYQDIEKKIPDPIIKTALFGE